MKLTISGHHLDVTPATAVARIGNDISARPLLAAPDPVSVVGRLLDARRVSYASADAVVNTESLDLQELVEQIAKLAVAWDVGVG